MPQQVQGVIARSKGAPVELVDITIGDPGPTEVVVRIQACGVCHTDLTYRDGGINDQFPFLLGHEAAGIVESTGGAVTHVEVGDFVVLNWRAVCGRCRACRRGRPWYCFDTLNASQPMTLADGDLALDLRTRVLTVAGREVELSAREFGLMETFLRHPGQVLSREQLLSRVWGYDFDPGSNVGSRRQHLLVGFGAFRGDE